MAAVHSQFNRLSPESSANYTTGTRTGSRSSSAKSRRAVVPARARNTTAPPSLSHRKSAMGPATSSVASWLAVRPKAALDWRLLHKSLSSPRACRRIWVPVRRGHQASTRRLALPSTLAATSQARLRMVSSAPSSPLKTWLSGGRSD
jgi:hypothetical protein